MIFSLSNSEASPLSFLVANRSTFCARIKRIGPAPTAQSELVRRRTEFDHRRKRQMMLFSLLTFTALLVVDARPQDQEPYYKPGTLGQLTVTQPI